MEEKPVKEDKPSTPEPAVKIDKEKTPSPKRTIAPSPPEVTPSEKEVKEEKHGDKKSEKVVEEKEDQDKSSDEGLGPSSDERSISDSSQVNKSISVSMFGL